MGARSSTRSGSRSSRGQGRRRVGEQDPHRIDALSGATITSNGVARMMAFWFSDYGFGPYLKRFREGASS